MDGKSLIPKNWDVPEVFRQRLGSKIGKQRLMVADGHMLFVLHAPPKPDETERVGRLIWRKPDKSWSSSELGSGAQSVSRHLEQYAEILKLLDEQEEKAASVKDYFQVMDAVSPMQRASKHLHVVLQEARQACPDDRDIINFRDRAYEIERTADLLYAEAKHSMDYAVAKRAEEQAEAGRRMARSAHRLNVLAAFFFPLATISGIFGANLRTGLEEMAPPWPMLLMIATGAAIGYIITRYANATHIFKE